MMQRSWLVSVMILLCTRSSDAQSWRDAAGALGGTTRVLIVGTRPDDEDNALIAWLSLGRHIETAYLSLTRGESGVSVIGTERQSALAVVRTAELLAERERDGARQYFTRAFDVGPTPHDSIVDLVWPHDSLLVDVASVVRAFRPHVIISLFSDTDRDATRRVAARLAREAFAIAADTVRLPAGRTARLPAWSASRLLTSVPTDVSGSIAIDVGEFDRNAGRSYAELGADIRRLQRTQPPAPAPVLGPQWRYLRVDTASAPDPADGLFGGMDTTWNRFRDATSAENTPVLDSLRNDIERLHASAPRAPADSLAALLARIATRSVDVRASLGCGDIAGVAACTGRTGDLAVALTTLRERAVRALLGAASIVVDGTVGREFVAAGDSVPVAVTLFNGGNTSVVVRRIAAAGRNGWSTLVDSSVAVRPDSVARWAGQLRVLQADYNWWQAFGMQAGTLLHSFQTLPAFRVVPNLISGEDRIPTTGVEATITIAGIDVPIIERPLVFRDRGISRGDDRHPLAGVPAISVLLERTGEYERAGVRVDRLLRVFVSSARTVPETVSVSVRLPRGLTADSATRTIVLPPRGARNVFFRLRGQLTPGTDTISASVTGSATATTNGSARPFKLPYKLGVITHDYPHIPTQRLFRDAKELLEAVDVRIPPRLKVAYVKGNEDVQKPLGDLQVNVQAIEPSLLPVVDLTVYSTVLIGSGAFANDALFTAVPALQDFMRRGGTVVVLSGGRDAARSGLLPYTIGFDSLEQRVADPESDVRAVEPRSTLLTWPNAITPQDFGRWRGERARDVPAAVDARYQTVISTGDAGQPPTAATILVAPVGRGKIVFTSLTLDQQLAAINPGAARLFVNLLSAGLVTAK